jgi:hypothetical protein
MARSIAWQSSIYFALFTFYSRIPTISTTTARILTKSVIGDDMTFTIIICLSAAAHFAVWPSWPH